MLEPAEKPSLQEQNTKAGNNVIIASVYLQAQEVVLSASESAISLLQVVAHLIHSPQLVR